jgi:broad specificity phosphatase PhoE
MRHFETDWNRLQIVQGSTDNPLNEYGRAEALRRATELDHVQLAAIYSSPQCRAVESAAPIVARHRHTLIKEGRFRECDFGSLDGMTVDEFLKICSPQSGADLLAVDYRPYGGEHGQAVFERQRQALEELRAVHPSDATILVVGHGRAIRTLLAGLQGTYHDHLENGQKVSITF